jgi:predicted dehydrogenase
MHLTDVADLEFPRAQALGREYTAQAHSDWQDLVRSELVDAVIVCTPPSEHAVVAIEALRAGKHVLCEKPLSCTPAEGREMVDAATGSGRILATGFNYRFYPSFEKAKSIFQSGLIGSLDHVRGYAGYSADDHSQAWIHSADVVGGGALRDNGIHLIDLARHFLGEVSEVSGNTSNAVWEFDGCEDNGFVLMRSPSGQVGALQASWSEWRGYRFQLEIVGTRGCIRASCFPMMTVTHWLSAPRTRPRRQIQLFPRTNIMEKLRSYRWVVTQSFVKELDAFERTIRGESTPLASGWDGLRAVEIAHQATQPSIARREEAPVT